MSQIVWTTLPTRIENGTLYASIFVSPRLDTTTIVGTPFEVWPDSLSGLSVSLILDPGSLGAPATVVSKPDSGIYKSVFSGTNVTPYTFQDNAPRPIWSYPVDVMKSYIDSVYAYVAQASPTALPLMDLAQSNPLTNAVTLMQAANSRRIVNRERMYPYGKFQTPAQWAAAAQSEKAAIGSLDPTSRAAYLSKRFYSRPANDKSKDANGNTLLHPAPKTPKFDFHQKVALLADHPYLMRLLGFVIDVSAPQPAGLPAPGFVRAKLSWGTPPANSKDVTPRTAYEISGTRFAPRAQSAASDAQAGLLALEDTTRFATIQGEPDGDAQKLVDFASNMVRLVSKLDKESLDANLGPKAAPTAQGLPARRTTGFIVTRKGRDAVMASRFTANQALNTQITNAAQPDLYMDDLVRGFRVDVMNGSSKWVSLHRRNTTYSLGVSSPVLLAKDVPDEGYLKAASATSDPDPNGPPDMYLHEALFGWEGWSLAAPRPGRTIMPMYATDDQAVGRPDTSPSADFQVDARASVQKGSLLPLRFGQKYSFRARVVDLAGNSLAFDDPSILATPHATVAQIFKRFEPVPPPTLVLRNVVTEGESVEHLVIRSDENMKADEYAAFLNHNYSDPNFAQKVYQGVSDRHVAPPKTTQVTAEAHGAFDNTFLSGADRKAFFRLGTREEGTFSDKRIASLSVDDGYIDANPNAAMIVTPPQVPMDQRRTSSGGPDTSSLTTHRGDALAPGEYVVCGADNVLVPYLPDLPAGGAVFFDPSTNTDVLATTWQGSWPDLQCYRLRLAAGGSTVTVDASSPIEKVVNLPPATILTLKYASLPAPGLLPHMAYWLDLSQAADVKMGRHWMLTPPREVKLVHAVPRPLAPPLGFLKPSRQYEATFVMHAGLVKAHSRSTGHVDMEASWFEYLDLPSKPLPNDIPNDTSRPAIPQTGHAYQITFQYGVDSVGMDGQYKHEFGDTKHRRVTYKPVGTTRYREYFPAALIADTKNITLAGTADGDQPDKTFSIPSSARPLVPKVEYAVPTFKWDLVGRVSTRHGGGLRIYFQRPWYTSGEGEQIAVLLTHSVLGGPDTSGYVSRWGRDPIWNSAANAPLAAATFKNAKSIATQLRLAEMNATVDAAIFDVQYSPERQLWFCDIEMDPATTYFPFVSLSVARYQAASLGGIELSAMTRVDFAQLTADRTMNVAFTATAATLSVTGPVADNIASPNLPIIPVLNSRIATTAAPRTHMFYAYIQEQDVGGVGDVGWQTTSAQVELAGNVGVASNLGNYSGTVTFPTQHVSGRPRRLVVEEREYYAVDNTSVFVVGQQMGYRLVYIDTMLLP